jgi:hypothetical protein
MFDRNLEFCVYDFPLLWFNFFSIFVLKQFYVSASFRTLNNICIFQILRICLFRIRQHKWLLTIYVIKSDYTEIHFQEKQ